VGVVLHAVCARDKELNRRRIAMRVIFMRIILDGRNAFENLRDIQESPSITHRT
jgi:hypothetical protein